MVIEREAWARFSVRVYKSGDSFFYFTRVRGSHGASMARLVPLGFSAKLRI